MSNPYEFVRYPGKPITQTHPDRMATMAALYGLKTQDVQSARVLEIGCCDGGNLMPLAMSLPGSHFVGIDLTETDIAEARETAAALGLSNIEFHVFDLTELPGPLGQFDYVICHGVYSWVPDAVREKLLAVVADCLTPRGVAYVSYNAQPGGHFRQMIREMMLFHIKGETEPSTKLTRTREFLAFLKVCMERSRQPAAVIRQLDYIIQHADSGLYHDELSADYHPASFNEFISHAGRYGLQYLSETNYFVTRPEILGSEAAPLFAAVSKDLDPIAAPQYIDFLICAFFHQTLLCRHEIELKRPVTPERLVDFYFACPATACEPEDEADRAAGAESFLGPQGSRITTASPFLRQLMHAMMGVYPDQVHYASLPGAESSPEELRGTLLALMNMGIVAPHVYSPKFCLVPGERPGANPLARRQAARNRPVVDQRHSIAEIPSGLEHALIPLLDGSRTRAELLADLPAGLFEAGSSREARQAKLEEALLGLGRNCLLIS